MKKTKILIVDDEESFTIVVKINLTATERYEVRVENNPRNAIDTARDFSPDLILLDIVMPGLDGGDIKRQLDASPDLRSIPVIFVTALEASSDHPTKSADGAMIGKPVKLDVLVETIERTLAGQL